MTEHSGIVTNIGASTRKEDGSETPLLFDAVLYPHRSLSKKHFRILLITVTVLCTFAGLRFIAVGAWPVVLFVAADVFFVWLAFTLSYRSGRLYETLQLSDCDLILTRVHPNGRVENWRFEPYWAKLELKEIDGDRNQLSVSSHGKRVTFGHFLTPADRRSLVRALKPELLRLKG